jgi:hypothetical protein
LRNVCNSLLHSPSSMHHYHYHLPLPFIEANYGMPEISLHIWRALKAPCLNSAVNFHSKTRVSARTTLHPVPVQQIKLLTGRIVYIWYDMLYYMISYHIIYMIWYDMVWYDMIWYMIWYDMTTWHYMIW